MCECEGGEVHGDHYSVCVCVWGGRGGRQLASVAIAYTLVGVHVCEGMGVCVCEGGEVVDR